MGREMGVAERLGGSGRERGEVEETQEREDLIQGGREGGLKSE